MNSDKSENQLILFDIPSTNPLKQWSPNVTSIRMLLNYLNIPFATEWVEYPNIKPVLQNVESIEAHKVDPSEGPSYTVPAIQNHRTGVMGRFAIFEYLGKKFPNDPISSEDSRRYAKIVNDYLDEVLFKKMGVLAYTQTILEDNCHSNEYFQEKRKLWHHIDCRSIQSQPELVSQAMKDLAYELTGFKGLKRILSREGLDGIPLHSGKFLFSDTLVTFGDFLLVSMLFWLKQVINGPNKLPVFDYMDEWTERWYSELVHYATRE